VSVLGWRQWAVDRDGLLRPAWTPWSPFPPDLLLWRPDGMTEAHCLRMERNDPSGGLAARRSRRHPNVPGDACVCGLYAWHRPGDLRAAPRPTWTSRPIVGGVARLGGRLVVAARGYRAQRGYPVAVLDPDGIVSGRYPLARYRRWDALVAEWDDPRGEDADGEELTG
jgi:hypothetical protein